MYFLYPGGMHLPAAEAICTFVFGAIDIIMDLSLPYYGGSVSLIDENSSYISKPIFVD
jgi:hypothetical protein